MNRQLEKSMMLGLLGTGTGDDSVGDADPIGDALRADAVAYWKLDEASGDMIDSSGNGNTINIFAGTTARVTGKIDNGLHINSTDAQAGRATTNGLDLYPNSYSIDFWIKFTQITNDGLEHPIWGKSGPNETDWEFGAYCIRLDAGSCDMNFYTFANAIETGTEANKLLENIFYYITIERDNIANEFRMYVNNELRDALAIIEGDVNVPDAPWYFGDILSSSGTEKFIIDEFGVYTLAMTDEQRAYRYNAGAGRTLYP